MRKTLQATLLAASLIAGLAAPAYAADKPAADASHGDYHLPPFPADAHVQQSAQIDGRTLKYTVTVGSLPVRDDKGDVVAQVMFTAYTTGGTDRPVTFALNGGPGASSVYLNLGAIGPSGWPSA